MLRVSTWHHMAPHGAAVPYDVPFASHRGLIWCEVSPLFSTTVPYAPCAPYKGGLNLGEVTRHK
jgi:hypothetical protein